MSARIVFRSLLLVCLLGACATRDRTARSDAGTAGTDGTPAGVFSWRPPAALVVALSDLIDGREVAA